MLKRRNALALTTVLAIVAAGGCAEFGKDEWAEASPESQGYRWVGQGEPANFGSAYSFCRRTLRAQTEGARLEGGAGILTTQPGGPTTIPGRFTSIQGGRNEVADRRQLQGCMEAQGWELAETGQPPSGQPTSPERPEKPPQPPQ
jgi:hypothetical protein